MEAVGGGGVRESRRVELERSIATYIEDEMGVEPVAASQRARDILGEAASRFGSAVDLLTSWWWVRLLQGVLAVIVGVMFFARPAGAYEALVLTLGAWAIVDGTFMLVGALTQRSWQLAIGGIAGIIVGYLALTRPIGAAVVFFYFAAVWAMARGIGEIAFGANLRDETPGRGTVVVAGIVSLLFGIGMLLSPLVGILALAYVLGVYAFVWGVVMIALSIAVRSAREEIERRIHHFRGAQPMPA
jgi:uncharacterized membrane protein HdeD (DUF308 family)